MRDEALQSKPFSIDQMLHDGGFTPNIDIVELRERLSALDLVEEFSDTKLAGKDPFILSFDTQGHARLFALCLGSKGEDSGIFTFTLPNSVFQAKLLDDFRVDGGGVLSVFEKNHDNRCELTIVLKQPGTEYKDKITNLIKETISSNVPHLASEVTDLTL